MDRKRLERLREEWEQLRQSPQKAGTLERFAQKLGRHPAKRGKHPMWESVQFPHLPALSIPHHSKDIPKPTVRSILNQLEDDINAWDELLPSGGYSNGGKNGTH
jgi:hypothetical protein